MLGGGGGGEGGTDAPGVGLWVFPPGVKVASPGLAEQLDAEAVRLAVGRDLAPDVFSEHLVGQGRGGAAVLLHRRLAAATSKRILVQQCTAAQPR